MNTSPKPPKLAENLLYKLLPWDWSSQVAGDMEMEFHFAAEKYGLTAARVLYWKDVISTISPKSLSIYRAMSVYGSNNPVLEGKLLPPRRAESLLCLFLPRKEREEVIGSMTAVYLRDIARYGKKQADLNFWAETVRELFPFVNRFLQKAVRWGIATMFGDWIRHFIR